jgi:nucleoid-associated protein YgaU
MSLERAEIATQDGSIRVNCLFNPKEYTIARQNRWEVTIAKGKNIPTVEFSGGQPATLRMQLFFDTYEAGTDVRKHTEGLWKMMRIDEATQQRETGKGEPPKVVFTWGLNWTFDAVIENLSQRFTLFKSDGTPVRSTVDVTFKQIKDELKFAGTNPTSGGGEAQRVHIVEAGDRIDWIAFQEYHDSTKWRLIAEANNLMRPRQLRPGQRLIIPME